MKKSRGFKIRKVWAIKPITRVKRLAKKDILAKEALRDLRQAKRKDREVE